jgi:hypothetical protein
MTTWKRIPDGGWLEGRPAYESDTGDFIAQDYDDPDGSEKLLWFLHDDNGFVATYDTLREAKAAVG